MIFDGCIFDETIFDAAPCVIPPVTNRGRATRWPIYTQPEDDEDEFVRVLLIL